MSTKLPLKVVSSLIGGSLAAYFAHRDKAGSAIITEHSNKEDINGSALIFRPNLIETSNNPDNANDSQSRRQQQQERLKTAVAKSRDLCVSKLYESGIPGLVVAVSVNGKTLWKHGIHT